AEVLELLIDLRLKLGESGIVRRVAEDLAITIQIVRLALAQDGMIQAIRQPSVHVGGLLFPLGGQGLDNAKDRYERLFAAAVPGDLAQGFHDRRSIQPLVLFEERARLLHGQRRPPGGIDGGAKRASKTARKPFGVESREVLGGPAVVARRIGQQAAEE